MPWCPVCKSEYREGILRCSECKVDLVDELVPEEEYEIIASAEKEAILERLLEYLSFSDINGKIERNEEEEIFSVLVPKKDVKKAKKAFHAFYAVEAERAAKNEASVLKDGEGASDGAEEAEGEGTEDVEDASMEDELSRESQEGLEEEAMDDIVREVIEDEKSKAAAKEMVYAPSSVYVKKADQSKELKSSAYTFFFFGVLLFVVFILNLVKVMTIFSNIPALAVLGGLSVVFVAIGVNSINRSKKAAAEAVEEEAVTEALNKWMKANITWRVIKNADEPSLTPEINFLRRMSEIKERVTAAFGEMDDSYIDSVIEEFYNNNFDAESEPDLSDESDDDFEASDESEDAKGMEASDGGEDTEGIETPDGGEDTEGIETPDGIEDEEEPGASNEGGDAEGSDTTETGK